MRTKIDDMTAWKVFMAVANFGSMNKAAKKLNLDVSSVSRRIDSLEQALGYPLFTRRARYCELSIEGQRVIKEVAPVLLQYNSVMEGLLDDASHMQGRIKVSVPDSLTEHFLVWMAEFQDQHPDVVIEIGESNGCCEKLLGKEYDIVVGMEYNNFDIGKTFKLGEMPTYICASPTYLKQAGALNNLEDFKFHRVIINSTWMCPSLLYDPVTKGAFSHETGRRFRVESMSALKLAALSGLGIIIGLPKLMCQEELANGTLIRVLAPLEGLSLSFYGSILDQGDTPPRLKKVIEWIQYKWKLNFQNYEPPIGRRCALGLRQGFDL